MSFSPNSPSYSGLKGEGVSARITPEPGIPLISFRGIYKSFGENAENKVLIGVDLEVYPGETMVILGRSGSGKTVLTSMLVGLNTPDQGEHHGGRGGDYRVCHGFRLEEPETEDRLPLPGFGPV